VSGDPAAAEASLAEAERALADGDEAAAIAQARAGLEALGDDYAPDDVDDDTDLKLRAAEGLLGRGETEGPAETFVDVLRIRTELRRERDGG
jgi:hypothetical protein